MSAFLKGLDKASSVKYVDFRQNDSSAAAKHSIYDWLIERKAAGNPNITIQISQNLQTQERDFEEYKKNQTSKAPADHRAQNGNNRTNRFMQRGITSNQIIKQ